MKNTPLRPPLALRSAAFLAAAALCLLSPVCLPALGDSEYFVSPAGNDAWAGTREKPFATIDAARDHLRALKGRGRPPAGRTTVFLRGGTYPLSRTFELLAEDSADAGHPVEYRSAPGEVAILSGGRMLDPSLLRPVTDPAILRRLDPAARESVRQIDLRSAGITDFGQITRYGHAQSVTTAPLELFFNAEPMTLARYPNKGLLPVGKVVDKGSIPRNRDYSERAGTFEYAGDRPSRWAGLKDVWLEGTFFYGYADENVGIGSIDPEKKRITLSGPVLYGLGSGKPYQAYYAYNILEELDSPGEWYLDRETGILYFWPPSDPAGARILVSMTSQPLVALQDASGVTLSHLVVEGGRGIGIYIEGGRADVIDHCTVRDCGTSGIFMGQGSHQTFPHITHDDYTGVRVSREIGNLQDALYLDPTWDRRGGREHRISNCHVYNTGCGGIYLSGGSKKTLTPGNCVVENCRIHDYNRRNRFLWSGINVDGCGNKIAHCEIYNSDFQAIYAHGNDHLYEYNYIHDVTLDSDDTSAWYLGRDPSDQGNVVRYNYFFRIGRLDRNDKVVYCDDATCGVTVFGNVFCRAGSTARASVYSNSGSDLRVINNIFVDLPGSAVGLNSYWYMGGRIAALIPSYFGPNGIYRERLANRVDIKKPPYSVRYPLLADWLDPIPGTTEFVGMRPQRNVMMRNLVVDCGRSLEVRGGHGQFDAYWNFETTGDPGFVDRANRNFQLKADSIVFKRIPGFERIPFDQIGLRGSVGCEGS